MVIAALLRRLGEILVQERLTTPDVVEEALARAKTTGERLGEALVALGAVKSEEVLRALAQQQNLAYLSRDELPSPLPIVKNLSRSEEHTSELQSRGHLVCRLLLEKKKDLTAIDTISVLPVTAL